MPENEISCPLMDELCDYWQNACEAIDRYWAEGKHDLANIRSNTTDGWLTGFHRAATLGGHDSVADAARTLSFLWIYRSYYGLSK